MRTTLSICALILGLLGTYVVGTGLFIHGRPALESWELLVRPFASTNPVPCLVLAMSVALAFFGLAATAESKSDATPMQLSSVLLWGGLFCVVTAAGFVVLLFILWQQGATTRDLGLIYSLAAVQAAMGVILGGSATVANRQLRRVTVPVFIAGILETVCAGAVLVYGFTV